MLRLNNNGNIYYLFITYRGRYPHKGTISLELYMNVKNRCIHHGEVAEELHEYCSKGEVISLLPSAYSPIIEKLERSYVLIHTGRSIAGAHEQLPIFTINLQKAQALGLTVDSFDTIYNWTTNKIN